MRYWWVNQNQTYKAEVGGGYVWSPKRNKNDARNQFYENMREVAPGDLIFSFRDRTIAALGFATSNCYEAPKPGEFGSAGKNWEQVGWRADVDYTAIEIPITPKQHIKKIRPLLPEKYSPLQHNGDGLQSVYLAEISRDFADLLIELLRQAGNEISMPAEVPTRSAADVVRAAVEDHLESEILQSNLTETEKEQIVKSRRGQGRFRENVQKYEQCCRVTGVNDIRFLIASHIKPWRDATNAERLDGENGFLLSPNIDLLFDRGFISFEDDGRLLVSTVVDRQILEHLGVPGQGMNVGEFTESQRQFLSYHRREVFLEAGRSS